MKKIPNYTLYGEEDNEFFNNYLHIESIRARSQNYGWKFRPHQHHNLHQFLFIIEGGGQALIEGQEYQMTENMVLGIPPSSVHGFHFMPNTKGWVLSIPVIYLQNLLENDLLLLEHISQIIICYCDGESSQEEIQYLFNSIKKGHGAMDPSNGLTLRCLATLLITKIVKLLPPQVGVQGEATSQKQIILRNFQNLINIKFKERFSVADYARELSMTPTHLNRICRGILNISASELIHERSLLEAKRLLIYTSVTIAEVAYQLGFNDPAHFSKFFRNKSHQKPSDFRKKFMKLA